MTTSHDVSRPVLIGIADTAAGFAALDAAIRMAQEQHAPLLIIHVWQDVDWFLSAERSDIPELVHSQHDEQALLAGAAAHARATAPQLEIAAEFAPGSLYAVLLERSESARLLVLGTSGSAPGIGPIGTWYLEHARCPVLIVDEHGATAAQSDGAATVRMSTYG